MKTFIVIVFALLFALVTFFGLGPVLFADGTMQERMMTLVIVILLYILLAYLLRRLLRTRR